VVYFEPIIPKDAMQKSSMTKISNILEHTAHAVEHFDLNDLLLKINTTSKVYEYFGLIEYVEVKVPQEPESLQKNHTTKEGFFGYKILYNSTKKDRFLTILLSLTHPLAFL
jgi:hypothetical protein